MKAFRFWFGGILVPLLASRCATAVAADVGYYSVAKVQFNLQTNSGAPVPAQFPFHYLAQVRATAPNSVIFASVALRFLSAQSPTLLFFNGVSPSQSFLELTYPSGNQSFSFHTAHDGVTNLTLALPSSTYPSAPHISNFSSLQAIDPSVALTVSWDAFTGGTANDLIELQILNSSGVVFDSGALPGASGVLEGTATGETVPGGTLVAGCSYIGRLMFARVLSTNNAYAPGYSAYAQQTDFYMSTLGATPPALVADVPPLGAADVPANAKIMFSFNKPMRHFYSWLTVGITNSITNTWSADGYTLTVSSAFPWPTNLATWFMNQMGYPPDFGDTNDSPVMTETIAAAFTAGTNLLPVTPLAPDLQLLGPLGNGPLKLLMTGGETYRAYQLQFSSDLVNWTNLDTIQSTNSTVTLTDPNPAPTSRNYRVLVLP